ncbi:MAG: tyrosine-protein phosphatase [Hyphomicrobiaceae bacterium]
MFDLHCHMLPGVDDGAADLNTALEMARCARDQGVRVVACTPHILPGLYHNTGPGIRTAVLELRARLADAGIDLELVAGADNHISPTFLADLKRGHLLAIARSRYVLVEPPHHVAPQRLDVLLFELMAAGYVPILTHPERLSWVQSKADTIKDFARRGVWLQVTSGSLLGRFGRTARYWADKLVSEGHVQLLASDAHDMDRRPPDLEKGARAAEVLVGAQMSRHMVFTAPAAVLQNAPPPESPGVLARQHIEEPSDDRPARLTPVDDGVAGRLRRFLDRREQSVGS